jgi:hypothetical protein
MYFWRYACKGKYHHFCACLTFSFKSSERKWKRSLICCKHKTRVSFTARTRANLHFYRARLHFTSLAAVVDCIRIGLFNGTVEREEYFLCSKFSKRLPLLWKVSPNFSVNPLGTRREYGLNSRKYWLIDQVPNSKSDPYWRRAPKPVTVRPFCDTILFYSVLCSF